MPVPVPVPVRRTEPGQQPAAGRNQTATVHPHGKRAARRGPLLLAEPRRHQRERPGNLPVAVRRPRQGSARYFRSSQTAWRLPDAEPQRARRTAMPAELRKQARPFQRGMQRRARAVRVPRRAARTDWRARQREMPRGLRQMAPVRDSPRRTARHCSGPAGQTASGPRQVQGHRRETAGWHRHPQAARQRMARAAALWLREAGRRARLPQRGRAKRERLVPGQRRGGRRTPEAQHQAPEETARGLQCPHRTCGAPSETAGILPRPRAAAPGGRKDTGTPPGSGSCAEQPGPEPGRRAAHPAAAAQVHPRAMHRSAHTAAAAACSAPAP